MKTESSASNAAAAPPAQPPSIDSQNAGNSFARKLDPKEQARMDTMMSNMSKQASQFICDQTDNQSIIEPIGEISDLKSIPTIYFKNCNNCNFTINHRTTKVLIENCTNSKFYFNQPILTATLEAWKCKQVVIHSTHSIKTVQLDLSEGVTLELDHVDKFGTIVWNHLEDLHIRFEQTPEHNHSTGFKRVSTEHEDSSLVVDQFIIRAIDGAIKEERCIRLKNGFLSTEREAADWDRRNELFKERYVQQFLKDSGITINRKAEKAIPPNDPCPLCKSGKKYKKCCFNKKVLTGTEQEIKADLYPNKK